jgi:hypothetical protein
MGIDVYASWDQMSSEQADARITGFEVSSAAGGAGYLREAYHGSPYVTHVLMPESFDHERIEDDEAGYHGAEIPAAVLYARLPRAVITALWRDWSVYKNADARALLMEIGIEPDAGQSSYPFRVELGDGEGFAAMMLALMKQISEVLYDRQTLPFDELGTEQTDGAVTPEWLARAVAVCGQVGAVLCFIDLCEQRERETGRPCRIYASY